MSPPWNANAHNEGVDPFRGSGNDFRHNFGNTVKLRMEGNGNSYTAPASYFGSTISNHKDCVTNNNNLNGTMTHVAGNQYNGEQRTPHDQKDAALYDMLQQYLAQTAGYNPGYGHQPQYNGPPPPYTSGSSPYAIGHQTNPFAPMQAATPMKPFPALMDKPYEAPPMKRNNPFARHLRARDSE